MNKTSDKIKYMLLGAITGDALGTPLDGLSRQHIKSIFKSITDYTDATPALKGKLDQWKKPCLYSSAAQMMILLSAYESINKNNDSQKFISFLKSFSEISDNEFGLFRHTFPVLQYFLQNACRSVNPPVVSGFSMACAKSTVMLIPLVIPGILQEYNHTYNSLSFALAFNKDMHSAAGSLIFNTLLKRIINNNITGDILSYALDTIDSLYKKLESSIQELFDIGIIPDYLLNSVKDYLNIFSEIANIKDIETSEKTIITYVNTKIKTPATRATVNHPLAIIPFTIFLADFYQDTHSEIIFRVAELGGATSILCALTGTVNGAMNGRDSIPEHLLDELINKKRITALIDAVSAGSVPGESIQDFIKNEAALTSKEVQEKTAKLKHVKIKVKKPKSRQERERQLSAHVVESWTKVDKAKWKKKFKKNLLFKDDQSM